MHTKTCNMFAESNEDMPIISGMARTQLERERTMSKLAYEVTMITEYDNGEVITHEPRYFARRENAVAHAHHYTEVAENNGTFTGEWRQEWSIVEDSPMIRITANVQTVTIEEIEEQL
jgi:hypothetical protein